MKMGSKNYLVWINASSLMQKEYVTPRVAAILMLAFCIRLLGIVSRPIWYDESIAILFAEKGFKAMLYGTLAPTGAGSANVHPLGYYTSLWLWMKVFGESLVAARLLSILAALITLYLVYLIAFELMADVKKALISMLIASLSPFLVHYAQEIRMYSLLAMWLMLATYAYLKAVNSGHWKWWLLFSFSAAFAQYTHHLAAFYLIALALWPLIQGDWKSLYRLTVAGVAALIIYAPWAIQLPAQFSKVQNSYWVARPDISKFFTLILVYLTNTPLPAGSVALVLFMVLVIVTIGLVQTIKATRYSASSTGLWLLYVAFAPALLLFLFSQWQPVYIERALLPSGTIFCIWLAWVLTSSYLSTALQRVMVGMLVACSLFGLFQHVMYRDVPYGPFKELAVSLRQRMEIDDVIVHATKMSMLPTLFFDRTLPQEYIDDPAGSGQDTLSLPTQQVLGIRAQSDIESASHGARRVWLVVFQRDLASFEADPNPKSVFQYLNSHYALNSVETWNGLRVFLYMKKQP